MVPKLEFSCKTSASSRRKSLTIPRFCHVSMDESSLGYVTKDPLPFFRCPLTRVSLLQLVSADGSNQSDNCSEVPTSEIDSRVCTQQRLLTGKQPGHHPSGPGTGVGGGITQQMNLPQTQLMPPLTYQSASVLSSDLDSTSLFGTESEITLDRDMTECSSIQRLQVRKKPQRRKKRAPSMSRTSSYSSITDSTMSLNIITVSINMEAVNFLGISIVGQSNRGGDGGIYVGSIMKGGAVALDGRIEPGDMILQVKWTRLSLSLSLQDPNLHL